jgi:hypothetical protein
VTLIAPPLLRTGPGVEAEMVWSDGTQAACAASIEPNDASAISELRLAALPASSQYLLASTDSLDLDPGAR